MDRLEKNQARKHRKIAIKRHTWRSTEDKCLLNILKDQTLNGGKEGITYKKSAWREILTSFNAERVEKLELQQLKNRHKYFRTCYATMNKLLQHTGFGWDDDDKMIKATTDKWDELISKDNTVQEYRDKVWPSWPDLQEICATSTAQGSCATSSKGKGAILSRKATIIDLNKEADVQEIDPIGTHDSQVVCPTKHTQNVKATDKKMKSNANGSKPQDNPRGQKRTTDDAVNAIDCLADATTKIAEMKKIAALQDEAYSVKVCMEILKNMSDVDPRQKVKAAATFTNAEQRGVFVEMDEEMRTIWIHGL